jgi:hypothetical protein
MYGCSRSRVCDCTRRYDFSVDHGLVFPLKFLGVRVAAVYYIRRGQKKNADVADKYEGKYFCNYFAVLS